MSLKIRNGETVLFIGDSITDCGRRAESRPLGNGYVKLFADMATIREPDKAFRIINKGISGDRVTGLRDRWTDDVLRERPDWLSVKIGINDCHTVLRGAPDAVTPELYREAYDDVLARTRAELPKCNMLLIEPFYMSIETSENSFRRAVLDLLPRYIEIVCEMSQKYGTRLVRTHEMFATLLLHHPADEFGAEPVHPNLTGHLAIAEAVYAALSE
jgi:lysophospholipase L1-like esterase